MRKLQTIIFLLLATALAALAQQRMQVTHYSTKDGLPHNSVYCSLKSADGFLWLGTWYGLSRFDGTHFENYSTAFTPSSDQPPRKVETLVEDAAGNLWIKTLDWKLSVLYKRTDRFEDIYDELKPYARNLQVIKIQADGHGNVLLLTKDKNLLLAYTEKQSGRVVVKTLVDARGQTDSQYQLLHDVVQLGAGRANYVGRNYQIASVPLSKPNRQWAAARWLGWFQQQTAPDLYQQTAHTPAGNFQFSKDGKILLRDKATGKTIDIATMPAFNEIKHPHFLSMTLDSDGLLWLTATDAGVYKVNFTPRQFSLMPLPEADVSGVRCIYQLPTGDIWVGTRSKSLYILSAKGTLKHTLSYDKYHIGSVYHIMRDRKGCLWLSTKGDGLVKATPSSTAPLGYTFVSYRHNAADPSSISGNNVYMTYQDSHGRIWVATLDGGLNLVNEQQGQITFWNKYYGMDHYPDYGLYMDVRNMVEDSRGWLWIGTIDGLMSLDGNFKSVADVRFQSYRQTEINTRANSDIYALYKDSDKNIWMCTFGGGLSRLDGYDEQQRQPVLTSFGAREGLHNDVILSILSDRQRRLWLVNADGLSCYDYKRGQIRHFDDSDGFPHVSIEETAAMLHQNGDIWLGTRDGILTFNPQRLRTAAVKYPIYIIGGEVNNRDLRSYVDDPILEGSIIYADRLELKHSQSMFTLAFSALNYVNPERISYRYILKGYDRDWHYSGTNRIATYTNVPSGKYTFIVEAIDATNPDFHSQRQLGVTILPPWWATWWAYLIYMSLLVAALYASARYAKYQIRLKNDIYVQTKIAEYKRRFGLEQQEQQFVEQVNKIIADNLTNTDFEIEMIAQGLGMSRTVFFKKVKTVMGMSPGDMVKEYKLNHAVELLKHSNLSITDVAYQSGFNDVGYFGKCFRKKFGMSAREFLSKNQHEE